MSTTQPMALVCHVRTLCGTDLMIGLCGLDYHVTLRVVSLVCGLIVMEVIVLVQSPVLVALLNYHSMLRLYNPCYMG